MKAKYLIAACSMLVATTVFAQMTPQQQQQLPPSDPSSPQYNTVYLPSIGAGDTVRPAQNSQKYWGAIATDADNAKLGSVARMSSESKARQAAIRECKRDGGKNCKIDIAYYNQCAVLVTGDTLYNTSSAPTLNEAKRRGFAKCTDTNCRVYYSECSLPVQIQ